MNFLSININKNFLISFFIIFISLICGCSTNNFYTKVSNPSLHLRGVSVNSNITTVYLTVSNPTYQKRHFLLDCNGVNNHLVVAPRSDKNTRLTFISISGHVNCKLLPYQSSYLNR